MLADIARAIGELSATLKSVSGTKKDTALGFGEANAYHWDATSLTLLRVDSVSAVPLSLLRGINDIRATLEQNTLQFARAHSANNALLWGARGMGKSSLVKALHASIAQRSDKDLKRLVLVEINREDIASLPALMRAIAPLPARFIVFCDDLSFDAGEVTYKSLKTILDGGLEGRPANVLFYATSNRRHLMPRDMIDNERSTSINPGEAVDEKISLSDRFGLWLGFHNCSQDEYLEMVAGYSAHYGIQIGADELRSRAIAWAAARGARSGRVAIQFIRQLAGEKGQAI
ncbi:MAG TPA: ATP-binding protein [Devosia sp.]|nr:ATP-binding protein [Devosia sp.]